MIRAVTRYRAGICSVPRAPWWRGAASRHAGTCLLVGALGVVACSRSRSELREWKPSDHDHTEIPASSGTEDRGGEPARPPMGFLAEQGVTEVALSVWKTRCVSCHGLTGGGDGPQGPMTQARNLADPAWHASTSDERIVAAIRQGKGKMPAFDLPDSTLESLVRLIRLMGPGVGSGAVPQQPSASGPNVPSSSAHPGPATPLPATSASPAPRVTTSLPRASGPVPSTPPAP